MSSMGQVNGKWGQTEYSQTIHAIFLPRFILQMAEKVVGQNETNSGTQVLVLPIGSILGTL